MQLKRLDPDYLVVSILALNPIFNESIEGKRLSESYLKARICAQYPSKVLKYAGVRPHPIHRDSTKINNALNALVARGVLSRDSNTDVLNWSFCDSPSKYYHKNIMPALSKQRRFELEEFAKSFG